MWRQVTSGSSWRAEVCNVTREGNFLWFDSVIAPIVDEAGAVERIICLRSDITARKVAEQRRNELNRLVENILSAATEVSIIATDLEGTITLFNRGAERMLGYSAAQMVGRNTPAIIHLASEVNERVGVLSRRYGHPVDGFEVFVHRARMGEPETRRWTYVRQDGVQIQVLLQVTGMPDANGRLIGFLGIATDITDQLAMENALRAEKEKADAANIAKSQFLANVSHEIRTPMNAVLGMLALLQQTGMTPQQRDYAAKAQTAARALLGLLNDVLDFSKISAEKLALDPTRFELEDLLRELAVILAGNLYRPTVELILDIDHRLPAQLIADRLRLQQVLVNLVGNALKFTECGYVRLAMVQREADAGSILLHVEVEDTGIGIDPQHHVRIFEGFSQAEASTTRRFGGTGLGLVISKRLVELMGGELYLDSVPGRGSRFWFDLRLPATNSPALIGTPSEGIPTRVLLLVGNQRLGLVLERGLVSLGVRVTLVNDVDRMRTLLEPTGSGADEFDVAVLDEGAGEDRLCALLDHIRTRCTTRLPWRIVLARRPQDSGVDMVDVVLTKPVTLGQLREAIEARRQRLPTSPQTVSLSRAPATPLHGLRLLVVEDNAVNRQVASELLTLVGAEVHLAEGGESGVAAVVQSDQSFDLVIMDVQMPDIDGFEATRRIRADARFRQLPILAMTANASASDRAQCLQSGMTEHIGKPFDLDLAVSMILRLVRADESGDQSSPAPLPAPSEVPGESPLLEPVGQILRRVANKVALAERLRDKFGIDVHTLIEDLTRAQQEGDLVKARLALHSIKGMSATMGARLLSERAAMLEQRMKEGVWPEAIAFQSLHQCLSDTLEALAALEFSVDSGVS
jgi:PAS domain S-box-containing protein